MSIAGFGRAIVALATLLFASVALALWIAPEQAAQRLGLDIVGDHGLAVVRADLAGLFGGLAILSGMAAWTRRRSWVFAAASVLVLIVVGRALEFISHGLAAAGPAELAAELTILGH